MIITLSIIGLLIFALIFAKMSTSNHFKKEVNQLFALSPNVSDRTFHKSQLNNLPDPVQRYFNYTLKDGQPYIIYARMKHRGLFKTGLDKDLINIKGEQYATIEKPGFIWKGTTSIFTAYDKYIDDKGEVFVSLFSKFKILEAKGQQYDQGELLRWLGESILYPTNFLPDERLQWLPIDKQTAKLIFKYNEISLYFNVTFNEIGEITEMETKRYMDKDKMEPWIIKLSHYKDWNNMMIPSRFEVIWRVEKRDYSYAKFHMTEIEYNKPEKF
jgi:hypothetical protein